MDNCLANLGPTREAPMSLKTQSADTRRSLDLCQHSCSNVQICHVDRDFSGKLTCIACNEAKIAGFFNDRTIVPATHESERSYWGTSHTVTVLTHSQRADGPPPSVTWLLAVPT